LPRHTEVVADVAVKVAQAIKLCVSAGIPIKDKLRVDLSGKGVSTTALATYTTGSNPPTVVVTPAAYKRSDLIQTLVHELGHYVHDRVVPGGDGNREITGRFNWAMSQVKATTPRKGKPFEFMYRGGWLGYSHGNRGYPMTGKIIGKGRAGVRVQILKYPAEILNDPKLSFDFLSPEKTPLASPTIELDLDKLLYSGRQTQKRHSDDHGRRISEYGDHQHDWVPTSYSRKNRDEWFAEMVTTFVLGHLAKEPSSWMASVLKTGKAAPISDRIQESVLVERARHEIDAEWIKGIRKGWKQAVAKAKAYPGRYEKAAAIDLDKLRASAKGAEGSMDELVQYVRALRADLLVNKGFWTTRMNPRKDSGKEFEVDLDALKAKVVAGLDKAEDAAREAMRKAKFWGDVLTPDTTEYRLDGGRRFADAGDGVGQFQRYVNGVFLAVEEGADAADRSINWMLDYLRWAMGKLPNAVAAIGSLSSGEPDVVHLGKVTVVFGDSPRAWQRPMDRTYDHLGSTEPQGPFLHSTGGGFDRRAPRNPHYRREYIAQLKKAEALLKRRGLGFLWYGDVAVLCKECGGKNPAGAEWGMGASYYRIGDRMEVYDDASSNLYQLIAHEFGHRFYYKFMSAADRANFGKWFGKVSAVSDYGGVNSSEDFAEVFSAYVDGRGLSRDQIDRFKQFIKGDRKMESAHMGNLMIHEQLSAALVERKAKTKPGERRYTVDGKKGVWRTSDAGHKLFIPDNGSSPLMNPHVKSGSDDGDKSSGKAGSKSGGKSGGKSRGKAGGKSSGGGGGGGGGKPGWMDRLKSMARAIVSGATKSFKSVRDLIKDPAKRAQLKSKIKSALRQEATEFCESADVEAVLDEIAESVLLEMCSDSDEGGGVSDQLMAAM